MNNYNNFYSHFAKGNFGSYAISILAQSAIGGIAAMAILQHGNGLLQMTQLLLVVIACITFNGAIISVQKPKVIFNILLVSAILCILITAVNFAS